MPSPRRCHRPDGVAGIARLLSKGEGQPKVSALSSILLPAARRLRRACLGSAIALGDVEVGRLFSRLLRVSNGAHGRHSLVPGYRPQRSLVILAHWLSRRDADRYGVLS